MQIFDGLFRKAPPPTDVVSTKYGKVVGHQMLQKGDRRVNAFKGIPFAKPPLGQLRFKKPVAPDAWEGVLKATRFANRCVQVDGLFIDRLKYGACSEDCLYLNVFAPAPTNVADASGGGYGEANKSKNMEVDAEKMEVDAGVTVEPNAENGKEKKESLNVVDEKTKVEFENEAEEQEAKLAQCHAAAQPNAEAEETAAPPPSKRETLFPVMVFIHGGSFATESASKYGDVGIAQHLVSF